MKSFDDYPLYVTIAQAVAITGLSERDISSALHSVHPLAHIPKGNSYKINKHKLRDYFEQFEVGGRP